MKTHNINYRGVIKTISLVAISYLFCHSSVCPFTLSGCADFAGFVRVEHMLTLPVYRRVEENHTQQQQRISFQLTRSLIKISLLLFSYSLRLWLERDDMT